MAFLAGIGLGLASLLADGVIRWRAFGMLGNIASPWALAAFAVGRLAASARRGAWIGTLTLLWGVAFYYVLQAARWAVTGQLPSIAGYVGGGLLWLAAAVTAGPAMGWCGAVTARSGETPFLAAVSPSAVLVAEAGFLFLDRRPWLWNLPQESYRLNDLAVMIGLLVIAIVLPVRFVTDRRRRRVAYGLVLALGIAGTFALRFFYRLLVATT